MTFEEFQISASTESIPTGSLPETLIALWYAKKGDWNKAHQVAQDIPSHDGSWIHAYLHRVEGDTSNAQYWYSRAGKPFSQKDLNGEWEEIVRALLK